MKKETLKHIQHRQAKARSVLARKHARARIRSWWTGHPDRFKDFMAAGRGAANAAKLTRYKAHGLVEMFRQRFGKGAYDWSEPLEP